MLRAGHWRSSEQGVAEGGITVCMIQILEVRYSPDTFAPISKRQAEWGDKGGYFSLMSSFRWIAMSASLALVPATGLAQAPAPPQVQAPQQQQQQQEQQQQVIWERMSRMQLEASYAGPLKDTVIQRWRDPTGEAVCYLYVPFTASHSPPTASGYVQYGPNTIGAISCVYARPAAVAAAPKPQAPAAPKPSPPRSQTSETARP
jgi:hypothetical protein